ncbi:MAG: glycosyltransferase family 2 protein [Planctomycetaceae bacterium]
MARSPAFSKKPGFFDVLLEFLSRDLSHKLKQAAPMNVSVITAFFNERNNLPVFRARVLEVLETMNTNYELVLVDDHSVDGSCELVRDWLTDDPRVRYIRLARNCGSHAAYSAGLAHCTGDCAVLLAADLQDPPESIPALIEQWRSGFDVVWAARSAREGESWSTKLFASIYYRLMRLCALPEMPAKGADFLLMDRKVIDAYNAIPEKNTSFLVMILWLGFRQTSIEYVKQKRHSGRSKWSLTKKLKLFVDSFVSFSYAPIRFMSWAGMGISFLGFVYALVVITNGLRGIPVQGWAWLMVVVLILGGFQLLMLGILGEYLWRAFDEARGRPRYVIEEYRCSSESHVESLARLDTRNGIPRVTIPGVANRSAQDGRSIADTTAEPPGGHV